MNPVYAMIAAATLGVDIGWEPLDGGGLEYIIQIEPQLLETLKQGKDLTSEIPRGMNVRKYRITVGSAQLPQKNEELPTAKTDFPPESKQPSAPAEPAAETKGPQPNQNDFGAPPAAKGDARAENSSAPIGMPFGEATNPKELDIPSPSDLPDEAPSLPTYQPPSKDTALDEPAGFPREAAGVAQAVLRQRVPEAKQTERSAPVANQVDEHPTLWKWTLALLTLLVSLGGNMYLGWIAWDWRRRYRTLADEFSTVPSLS